MHSLSKDRKDDYLTPQYAVKPILKYLDIKYKDRITPEDVTIWCPFDKEDSAFVKILRWEGYNVVYSHIDYGQDFFVYEPEKYDIIISNPPFSLKDKILKRLRQFNKPFCIMTPIGTLQGQKRFEDLVGCQALIFNRRIKFILDNDGVKEKQDHPDFATIYLTYDFLPKDLIFEELKEE